MGQSRPSDGASKSQNHANWDRRLRLASPDDNVDDFRSIILHVDVDDIVGGDFVVDDAGSAAYGRRVGYGCLVSFFVFAER